MDINEIMNGIFDLPKWAWVIVFFLIIFIFGDKKKWEYEAEFPFEEGKGSGDVEFECYKKKGSSIEIEFDLVPAYDNKAIEIYLNSRLIYTVPQVKNSGGRIRIEEKFELAEPTISDLVTVKIAGEDVFKAKLRKD